MKVVQILFVFAACLHTTISMFPSREQIYVYFKVNRDGWAHFAITTVMTVFALAVPVVYPDINGLLGLVGGITVGTSGYILPFFLMFWSLHDEFAWYNPKRIVFLFLSMFVVVLGIGSTYVSLFYNAPTE